MATISFYPLAEAEELKKQFVRKSLKQIVTPAAVLDLAKVRKNCEFMLNAVNTLKFGWRAHIKTHKACI
jgi:D-serine deaminase-like pyridoxal phosphate-dependent protein